MTEQEAKTKWCPMVRAFYTEGDSSLGVATAALNTDRPHDQAKCIGTACMMWRWDGWQDGARVEDCQGHCGLAGDDKTARGI